MSSLTGYSANNPTRYLGPNVAVVTSVTRNRAPTGADYRQPETGKLYPFSTLWLVGKNPTTGEFGDLWYLSKIEGNVAYWVQVFESSATITGDDGGPLVSVDGNWNIIGEQDNSIPVMQTNGSGDTLSIEDRTHTTAFVVDSSTTPGTRGTFATIQAAVDAASSGQTVFLKSGTYTENVVMKAGVNLAAYGNSGFTPTVNIVGKVSFTQAGAVTISGIGLQSNGDYALAVTGTLASRVFLIECNVIADNFAAIQLSSSGASSSIRLINCWGRTNTNATNFFVVTGVGSLTFWNVNILDPTPQTIPSTFASTGGLLVKYSIIRFPITTSGTGRISATDSEFNTFQTNTMPLSVTASASGLGNYIRGCILLAGSAQALNVGAAITLNMLECSVITTNTNPIAGTGTLNQAGTSYINQNPIPRTTGLTLVRQAFDPGALWGNWDGTAPAAGYVGQKIESIVRFDGPPIALSTGVAADVTSISLTAGTWDVSGIVMFSGIESDIGNYQNASINTTSANISNSSYGERTISATFSNTAGAVAAADDSGLSIPSYRINVPKATGTQTVYLIARAGFVSGTVSAYGRISATRVC